MSSAKWLVRCGCHWQLVTGCSFWLPLVQGDTVIAEYHAEGSRVASDTRSRPEQGRQRFVTAQPKVVRGLASQIRMIRVAAPNTAGSGLAAPSRQGESEKRFRRAALLPGVCGGSGVVSEPGPGLTP